MSNSSFQKNTPTPISVSKGGTGLSSISSGGVVVGNGTGSVNTVAPSTSDNVLTSNGTSWTSASAPTPSDGTINYSHIAPDLTQIVDLGASNNVDWSLGAVFTKTLTSNTVLTFSNYKLNKSIVLKIKGNYYLSLPKIVKNINGVYVGTNTNYIFLHCTKSTSTEEVWATINQKMTNGYGYLAGGYNTTYFSNAYRISFSSGVISSNTVSNLYQARAYLAGVSDASIYGYFAGGDTGGGYFNTDLTDRIVFSTGATSANTVSNLSQIRAGLVGVSDSSTYGYFAGGINSGYTNVSTADRIVFSTGATSANTVSNLSQARRGLSGVSDSSTYGYFAGGYSGNNTTALTDRIIFSTGVNSANTVSNLYQARSNLTGVSDGYNYGYFAGGTAGTDSAITDRIIFSTSITSTNTASYLSYYTSGATGISDSSTYGYFVGGNQDGNPIYTTYRIVFSTGVTSLNTASNLPTSGRAYMVGVSDCAV